MHDVRVDWTATDNSGTAPVVTLSVTSSEAANGTGVDDGSTLPDWEIVSNRHVRLRAERAGTGSGRVYAIPITAVDARATARTRP